MEFEQPVVDPMFQNLIPYSGAYTYYGQGKEHVIDLKRNVYIFMWCLFRIKDPSKMV